ncbi:hypothetical protein ABLT15_35770 [Paraburkholderia tropica]|uniref:hypothetical protein n=1 Tax=Paraburkholderia tropica TaxID=92647 RepID=UPI0032B44644
MPAHRMNMRMIKDVLRLKFDGGFSHDRIAASLGISKGVVIQRIGRHTALFRLTSSLPLPSELV